MRQTKIAFSVLKSVTVVPAERSLDSTAAHVTTNGEAKSSEARHADLQSYLQVCSLCHGSQATRLSWPECISAHARFEHEYIYLTYTQKCLCKQANMVIYMLYFWYIDRSSIHNP